MALSGGTRFKVSMGEVFPGGCALVPGSITEAQDYDERTGRRSPAKDKVTGQRVWSCRVMDMDPELDGRSREVAVKILAEVQPVPPTGEMFEPVEFENLMVTPYANDKGRMAYSFRATAITAPRGGKSSQSSGPPSASSSGKAAA
jgi:hypothetical protein